MICYCVCLHVFVCLFVSFYDCLDFANYNRSLFCEDREGKKEGKGKDG